MAHSAAHLARMQGKLYSREALEFKMEAMQIVSVWIDDQTKALSDDMFSAVLGLLTYEVLWTKHYLRTKRKGLTKLLNSDTGELKQNGKSIMMACCA